MNSYDITSFKAKVLGLIPTGGQELLKIGGNEVEVREFTESEKSLLATQITSLIPEGVPKIVQDTVLTNLPLITNVIRAVKKQTNSQFKGPLAEGKELTLKQLTVDDFNAVWGNTTNKTFESTVTAGNVYDYLGTDAQPESTDEEESIIILGFIERSPEIKINQVQMTKNGRMLPVQELPLDVIEGFKFIPLAKPFVALPETYEYRVRVKALRSGDVIFEPYGFKVCMAASIPNLF